MWGNNSVCVHATAPTREGPFVDAGVALPVFCHGPKVVRAASGGGLLLFHIGAANDSASRVCDCAAAGGSEARCRPLPPPTLADPRDGRGLITWASAPGFGGPWTPSGVAAVVPRGGKEGWLSNPAVWPLRNRSLLLAFRSWGPAAEDSGGAPRQQEYLFLARRDGDDAPFERVTDAPVALGEDPFVWTDADDNIHLLTHSGCGYGHSYAEARAPATFYAGPHAVNCSVRWANGTTSDVHRRERPHLVFGADGAPALLLGGVQPLASGVTDASFTMATPVLP